MSIVINRNIPVNTKYSILFGGLRLQIGWLFFSIGLCFFWGVALNADISFLYFTGNIITVEGIATDSFETNVSYDETPVYENHYKFTTKEGAEFEDFSYYQGQYIKTGETITIEYPEGKPQYSRIKGMRRQAFGPVALFVVIIPMFGLLIIFFCIKKYLHVIRLLKNGELTKGKLISKVPTNIKVDEQTVYKLKFSFKDKTGNKFNVSEKTHQTHFLEDDDEESLLYMPDNPEYAILIDSLPKYLSFDEKGNIQSISIFKLLPLLILPLLTLVGHGSYFVIKFII